MLIFYHILNFTKFLKLQDEDLAPNGLLPPKDTEVKRAKIGIEFMQNHWFKKGVGLGCFLWQNTPQSKRNFRQQQKHP